MIALDYLNYEEVEWDGMAFKEMNNLKTLIIRGGCFTTGPKHLPNSLRVLEWRRYPSPSLPFDFNPKKLVSLQLPDSCLTSLNWLNSKNVSIQVLFFNSISINFPKHYLFDSSYISFLYFLGRGS